MKRCGLKIGAIFSLRGTHPSTNPLAHAIHIFIGKRRATGRAGKWWNRADLNCQPRVASTNKTIQGDYGSQIEGTILGPNLPFRGLAMAHFDGKGNITQADHIVFNGIPPLIEWTPGTGTYTVNPDCTGSAVINSPSGQGPVNLHFVVVNNGKQINQ